MKILKKRPIVNSMRNTSLLNKNVLIKNASIFKGLKIGLTKKKGRSATTGHITSWHKQRGAKKLYRPTISDKKKLKTLIVGVTYNPNKNSFNSINFDFKNSKFLNDIHVRNTYPGSLVSRNSNLSEIRNGYRCSLKKIPIGALISNIGSNKSTVGQFAKSAGTFAQLIQKDIKNASIKLPSSKILVVSINSLATIGSLSNEQQKNIKIGKAGRSRNLGRRPIVRGIAMNPVDHPHGGRTNGGRPSVTPWGLPTKNKFKLKKKKRQ